MTIGSLDNLSTETAFMSSPGQMENTPSYKALLAKGKDAIPDLLQALRDNKAVLPALMLLNQITGVTPFESGQVGNVKAMVSAWLKWGEKSYTPQQKQRIHLKARRKLGLLKRDDAQDRFDFMEQCIQELEDEGVDDAEQICQLLWEEGDY